MNLAEPPQTSMRNAYVDFSHVPERQADMHARLENWGRCCNGGRGDSTAPMFRQFRSAEHWVGSYASDTIVPPNRADATIVGRGVFYLPDPHRMALQWYYVQRTSVMAGRKAVGCTTEALHRYVLDARIMLINRGV